MKPIKWLIGGCARHGKDTAAQVLTPDYLSSSQAALELIMWPLLKDKYETKEECFSDRHNHRELWFNEITKFNTPNEARLAKYIFSKCDSYVGIRRKEEFYASKRDKLFDLSIWIDAGKRLAPEPLESCTVHGGMFDMIIENNGTEKQFKDKLITIKLALKFKSF